MALLRQFHIPNDLWEPFQQICSVEVDYVPGEDPIQDAIYLKQTNDAWAWLGQKLNFKWETVKPITAGPNRGHQRYFIAEPKDN